MKNSVSLQVLKNRQDKGLCPICSKEIKNQKVVSAKYKNIKFTICEEHIKIR